MNFVYEIVGLESCPYFKQYKMNEVVRPMYLS